MGEDEIYLIDYQASEGSEDEDEIYLIDYQASEGSEDEDEIYLIDSAGRTHIVRSQ